jgi:hypothetical protein
MSISAKEMDILAEKLYEKLYPKIQIQNEQPLNSKEAKEILKITSDSALNSYMKKGLKHHQIAPRSPQIFFKSEIMEFLKKYEKVGVH